MVKEGGPINKPVDSVRDGCMSEGGREGGRGG